jgi:hypothetical protein
VRCDAQHQQRLRSLLTHTYIYNGRDAQKGYTEPRSHRDMRMAPVRALSMVTRVLFWPGTQRYPFRASSSSPPGFRAAARGCGGVARSVLRAPHAPTGLVRSVDEHLPVWCVEDAGVAL